MKRCGNAVPTRSRPATPLHASNTKSSAKSKRLILQASNSDTLAGPDLPIGYRLGPQDPRGPPTNYGTHRVNGR